MYYLKAFPGGQTSPQFFFEHLWLRNRAAYSSAQFSLMHSKKKVKGLFCLSVREISRLQEANARNFKIRERKVHLNYQAFVSQNGIRTMDKGEKKKRIHRFRHPFLGLRSRRICPKKGYIAKKTSHVAGHGQDWSTARSSCPDT